MFWRKEKTVKNRDEKKPIRKPDFYCLLGIVLALCLMLTGLIFYQKGVLYQVRAFSLDYVDITPAEVKEISQDPASLIIWEDGDTQSGQGLTVMEDVLSQMKEPYTICETEELANLNLDNYQKIVLAVSNCIKIADSIESLKQWIWNGGSLMLLFIPYYDSTFMSISNVMGIKDFAGTNAVIDTLHFVKDLMPGGMQKDYGIEDAYDSSASLSLMDDCTVYLESGEVDGYPVPLIWTHDYGSGMVVTDNLGFLEKAYRGFHCAAYSLLTDACIYPVINASTFYIDDFPSPVPGGNGEYITRDYGLSISDFYTQIWWPDVYNLAKKHGIRYTGLTIEEYSDQTSGTFERNQSTERYSFFGNMLLQMGGEIGIHGYNHMPLVLENFDYEGLYDSYIQWESLQAMEDGFSEVLDFTQTLYPEAKIQTYVPPSNIISEEGREMLAEKFPTIRSVAAVYFPGELAYEQEFDVSEDGIVNTPRIISGYVLGDYSENAALSELTFHYVNTHFQHPDDVLDEDRGAALGWEKLISNLTAYVDWLYEAAPVIRNLTGSELGAAVQRYDYLQVERTENAEGMDIHLENFYDEAWLMLRINCTSQTPEAEGAELTAVGENLYLVHAQQADFQLYYERQGS